MDQSDQQENVCVIARVRAMCRSGIARAIREANDLSLREMGEGVGVGAPTIYRWEVAQRMPRGEAAVRYGNLLEQLVNRESRR